MNHLAVLMMYKRGMFPEMEGLIQFMLLLSAAKLRKIGRSATKKWTFLIIPPFDYLRASIPKKGKNR
jgi:hypothetical protein